MRILSLVALVVAGCGSNVASGGSGADMAITHPDLSAVCGGGPVAGAADAHCMGDSGILAVPVDAAMCMASGGATTPTYGATMFGSSGYDDGCKYLVSYKVSPICEDRGVTFSVIVKSAVDGSAVTGATPSVDVALDGKHAATSTVSSELAPGVYDIGPVVFEGNGTWTVRFHFFDNCVDLPSSPRSQAAFFIQVD